MAKKTVEIVMTEIELELAKKIEYCNKQLLQLIQELENANNLFPVDIKEHADIYFANAIKQLKDEKMTERVVRKTYEEAMDSIKGLKNAYAQLNPQFFEDQVAVKMMVGRLSRIEDLLREVEVIRMEIHGIEFSSPTAEKNTKSAFTHVLHGFANVVVFLRTNVDAALSAAKRALTYAGKALEKIFSPVTHLVKKTHLFSRKSKPEKDSGQPKHTTKARQKPVRD